MSLSDRFLLKRRNIVITGGVGMLGKKHAEAVAEFAGNPLLIDIDSEKGEQVSSEIRNEFGVNCCFFKCDITNEHEVADVCTKILEEHRTIDGLINNAAIDPKLGKNQTKNLSRLENFPFDQWQSEVAVGLTGAMLCSKHFGNEMAKNGKGVILNVASDLGVIAPDQRLYRKEGLPDHQQSVKPVTYSVIKHGLIGLTKYLATYWADKGVRANSISPGGVFNHQPDDFVQRLSSLIPLGRMADIEEYKAAIVFLISDASSYMTGSNLVMDGGRSCW